MSSLITPSRSSRRPGRSMTDLSPSPGPSVADGRVTMAVCAGLVSKPSPGGRRPLSERRPADARFLGPLAGAGSVAALVNQRALLDPGHHPAQLGADLLDLVGVIEAPRRLEAWLAGLALANP